MTELWVLGSGSAGNAIYLSTGETRLLIDIGFGPVQLSQRLKQIGADPARINAVLISHEHSDHIRGLNLLRRKDCRRIFCYANRPTAEAVNGAIQSFVYANEVEKIHAELYKKALAAMGSNPEVDYYVCQVCGNTVEGEAPDECPVCGAKKQAFRKVE